MTATKTPRKTKKSGKKLGWVILRRTLLVIVTLVLVLAIALVLDLVCVIIGSQLWKKANRTKPASKKNKFLFWLWNNMGVIVCAFAFIPFVILALTDKKADKKAQLSGLLLHVGNLIRKTLK